MKTKVFSDGFDFLNVHCGSSQTSLKNFTPLSVQIADLLSGKGASVSSSVAIRTDKDFDFPGTNDKVNVSWNQKTVDGRRVLDYEPTMMDSVYPPDAIDVIELTKTLSDKVDSAVNQKAVIDAQNAIASGKPVDMSKFKNADINIVTMLNSYNADLAKKAKDAHNE